jgi:hypothetical protein
MPKPGKSNLTGIHVINGLEVSMLGLVMGHKDVSSTLSHCEHLFGYSTFPLSISHGKHYKNVLIRQILELTEKLSVYTS